jgi:hypothetical protein
LPAALALPAALWQNSNVGVAVLTAARYSYELPGKTIHAARRSAAGEDDLSRPRLRPCGWASIEVL